MLMSRHHLICLCQRVCHRFFAVDVFACLCNCNGLVSVNEWWSYEVDRVDVRIGENVGERCEGLRPGLLGQFANFIGVEVAYSVQIGIRGSGQTIEMRGGSDFTGCAYECNVQTFRSHRYLFVNLVGVLLLLPQGEGWDESVVSRSRRLSAVKLLLPGDYDISAATRDA